MEFEIMQYVKDGGIYALIAVALYLHRDIKMTIVKKFDMLHDRLEKIEDKIEREIDLLRRNGKHK